MVSSFSSPAAPPVRVLAPLAAAATATRFCSTACPIRGPPLVDPHKPLPEEFFAKNEEEYDALMPKPLPFGELLGVAPPGVPAYSSDYDSSSYTSRSSYRADYRGVYTGYKYQCVEYARRWLVHALGVTFQDVHMAYHIFEVPHLIRVSDMARLPLVHVRNGASVTKHADAMPRLGSILIWEEGGFFKHTGHVGIVIEATESHVRIAEQNVTDAKWPGHYARELRVERGEDGSYHIVEGYARSHVLGWLHMPEHVHREQEQRHKRAVEGEADADQAAPAA